MGGFITTGGKGRVEAGSPIPARGGELAEIIKEGTVIGKDGRPLAGVPGALPTVSESTDTALVSPETVYLGTPGTKEALELARQSDTKTLKSFFTTVAVYSTFLMMGALPTGGGGQAPARADKTWKKAEDVEFEDAKQWYWLEALKAFFHHPLDLLAAHDYRGQAARKFQEAQRLTGTKKETALSDVFALYDKSTHLYTQTGHHLGAAETAKEKRQVAINSGLPRETAAIIAFEAAKQTGDSLTEMGRPRAANASYCACGKAALEATSKETVLEFLKRTPLARSKEMTDVQLSELADILYQKFEADPYRVVYEFGIPKKIGEVPLEMVRVHLVRTGRSDVAILLEPKKAPPAKKAAKQEAPKKAKGVDIPVKKVIDWITMRTNDYYIDPQTGEATDPIKQKEMVDRAMALIGERLKDEAFRSRFVIGNTITPAGIENVLETMGFKQIQEITSTRKEPVARPVISPEMSSLIVGLGIKYGDSFLPEDPVQDQDLLDQTVRDLIETHNVPDQFYRSGSITIQGVYWAFNHVMGRLPAGVDASVITAGENVISVQLREGEGTKQLLTIMVRRGELSIDGWSNDGKRARTLARVNRALMAIPKQDLLKVVGRGIGQVYFVDVVKLQAIINDASFMVKLEDYLEANVGGYRSVLSPEEKDALLNTTAEILWSKFPDEMIDNKGAFVDASVRTAFQFAKEEQESTQEIPPEN